MRYTSIILACLSPLVRSNVVGVVGVVGTAPGFAASTTGGGLATPQYPANIAELKEWLTDSTPRVIVLNKECTNGSAGAGTYPIKVTYDKAGVSGINVGSNKSLIGIGSAGVIRGKGLRIANGAKNVIIQNIHITELNPQYIWGGDALTVDGADLVWIDHCKVSLIGRQMFVAGTHASNRVTISNTEFDGNTPYSATCDNHHYWAIYLTGSSDLVTMKGNYIHHTSGRAPKISGNTLLHAVNNYWYAVSGHIFDVLAEGHVVAEGNVFQNVENTLLRNNGKVFASPSTSANEACTDYLGHACQLNAFGSSEALAGSDTSFFPKFNGNTIASADEASSSISITAGIGKI
ncbi:hypothetical protein LZ554_004090 [Drepanopeziza brunnea f. sp. 'monogermtubi']|nr:hypothetical protein LZ554_004090 [Drepanopeziza brunnea f. sp. 'monogermtubi']